LKKKSGRRRRQAEIQQYNNETTINSSINIRTGKRERERESEAARRERDKPNC